MKLREYIPANLEKILQEWEDYAGSIVSGKNLNREELRDHAKQMLCVIAKDLATPQTEEQQIRKSKGKGALGGAILPRAGRRFEETRPRTLRFRIQY